MKLPKPEPGLVIRYSYLWMREYEEGREEGVKDRPCAIILATNGEEKKQVLVVPITHTSPSDDEVAVELPQDVKRLLRLDAERSWVILSESNLFQWPGPDLRPSRKELDSSVAFGLLPPKIFSLLKDRFLRLEVSRRSNRIRRTE